MTNAPYFFTLSIMAFVLIAAVFAMKYAAAAYRARLETRRQTTADGALDALRQQIENLTKRVGSVEKLLREVE
ncbi:hypothetical protein GCM10011491_19120 [Brucella endophytica]|uniref:Uncharacterized protein n=1 Tax=Brucella endophytica TaxID=1963359 RepID=A0A916SAN5_9HYPH|nr:hypothetical protein [Brucella endophytica]GGA91293.1 hypothetical protein GCM10011491_19120 [Brucella endophytica]